MFPGPVFEIELKTTARRPRYTFARTIYGCLLLVVLWVSFSSLALVGRDPGFYSINQMSAFAYSTFCSLGYMQSAALLVLTPALVAGAIADEKRRKTLHYWLASRLTDSEIVLGKLFARLLHVGVFILIGLPVISLLTLFGGIDPALIWGFFAGTLSTVFALSALSILLSTLTKKPRDAILSVYSLEAVWLILPPLIEYATPKEWHYLYSLLRPPNRFFWAAHPVFPLISLITGPAGSDPSEYWHPSPLSALIWFVGTQTLFGILCVTAAIALLRKSERVLVGQGGALIRFLRRPRLGLFRRRRCGDDPMAWKELTVCRSGALARWIGIVIGLGSLVGLTYGTLFLAIPAFEEARLYGYSVGAESGARAEFHGFIQIVSVLIFMLSALGAAATAAGGFASEREGDTWISLISTDLTDLEIIRAKLLGAIWSARRLTLVNLLLWIAGVVSGALHPLGLVLGSIETLVFLWSAAALGTLVSIRSSKTARALIVAVALLFVINGGYLFGCFLLPEAASLKATLGSSPFVLGLSLFSHENFWDLLHSTDSSSLGPHSAEEKADLVATIFLSTLFHFCLAAACTVMSFAWFPAAADRPRRDGSKIGGSRPPIPPKPASSS